MKDLLLDKDGDLYLTPNGDVSLTDSVRQAILIRLRWFWGNGNLTPLLVYPISARFL